jgi:CRP-like cAMP-binding protein
VRPPIPPQPVSPAAKDSVVLLADAEQVIARAIQIGQRYEERSPEAGPAPPFFGEISRESFIALVPRIVLRRIERNDRVETGTSLLLVASGEVSGERGLRFGPGGVFGYGALIDEHQPEEVLRAELDCELIEIRRADVEELARQNGAFAAEIAEFVKREMLRSLLASPMLEDLDAEARIEILGSFASSIVPEGAQIIEEGGRASGLYLIGSGRVQITKDPGDATAEIAAVLGPGEVFGEIALLEYRPATASATAVQKSVIFHLDRARFVGLTARNPVFRSYLVDLAKARLALWR